MGLKLFGDILGDDTFNCCRCGVEKNTSELTLGAIDYSECKDCTRKQAPVRRPWVIPAPKPVAPVETKVRPAPMSASNYSALRAEAERIRALRRELESA
jgi:hypothetical protein